ncbi:unnamed protein product [Victoria cruziana]
MRVRRPEAGIQALITRTSDYLTRTMLVPQWAFHDIAEVIRRQTLVGHGLVLGICFEIHCSAGKLIAMAPASIAVGLCSIVLNTATIQLSR